MNNNRYIRRVCKLGGTLLAACCLLFTSCEDKEDVKAGFAIDETTFMFNEFGGAGKIKIESDQAWTAATNVEWCMISPANGSGNADCQVLVDTSYLYQNREGFVTFYSGSKEYQVNISQLGFKKQVFVKENPQSLPHFEFKGKNTFEIEVFSNVGFELIIPENDRDWLSAESFVFEPASIPRPQKIKFTYEPNNKFEERLSSLTFRPVGEFADQVEPLVVPVTQLAAPFIPVNSRAGDSMALLSIGRQLDLYWQYDPSKSIETWSDVYTEEITFKNEVGETVTDLRVTGVRFFFFETEMSLPYEITYLTELKKLITMGNSNSYLKRIKLGPEITQMEKLTYVELYAYGFNEICPEITRMQQLQTLDMDANNFAEIPLDLLRQMPNLECIGFGNNRLVEGITDLSNSVEDQIGLHGELPVDLFRKSVFPNLKNLYLWHNYYEGAIPNLPKDEVCDFERLCVNGNMLSGELPAWVLEHKNLPCWDPFVFVFNQSGKDSNGNMAFFINEPNRITGECELWKEEENNGDIDYNPDWKILEKYGVTLEMYKRVKSIPLHCK
ncbi:MAG: BACON domain-containing carbohydrate-binding protein [Bacteroidales bacterium]